MSFSERDKLKALAIVHIFETSKPLGDYSAVAVLDDGAGISYGINQFTHRSESLYAVLDRFQDLGGKVPSIVDKFWPDLMDGVGIDRASRSTELKAALNVLGRDPLMQQAQREIAFELYLKPALDACDGSNFNYPLSLAVIYDSINHGSYAKIRDRVIIDRPGNGSMSAGVFERLWITQYVQKRDAWLESVPRLRKTDYRTDFFLAQIARGNWDLDLPLNVHGYRLTEKDIVVSETLTAPVFETAELQQTSSAVLQESAHGEELSNAVAPQAEAPTQQAENIVNVGTDAAVPSNFVPEEQTANAPEPTGFMAKLKFHLASLGLGAGTLTALKEFTGVQLGAETVELLKVLLPTVLGLGFIGFLVWYVSEKVVGFKTLKLQSEINTDPNRHNLKIKPQ